MGQTQLKIESKVLNVSNGVRGLVVEKRNKHIQGIVLADESDDPEKATVYLFGTGSTYEALKPMLNLVLLKDNTKAISININQTKEKLTIDIIGDGADNIVSVSQEKKDTPFYKNNVNNVSHISVDCKGGLTSFSLEYDVEYGVLATGIVFNKFTDVKCPLSKEKIIIIIVVIVLAILVGILIYVKTNKNKGSRDEDQPQPQYVDGGTYPPISSY